MRRHGDGALRQIKVFVPRRRTQWMAAAPRPAASAMLPVPASKVSGSGRNTAFSEMTSAIMVPKAAYEGHTLREHLGLARPAGREATRQAA